MSMNMRIGILKYLKGVPGLSGYPADRLRSHRACAYVACGRLDAFEMNLKPWDYAAGLLLIEEAGGTVTGFQGEKPVPWEKGSIGEQHPIGQLLVDQYIN